MLVPQPRGYPSGRSGWEFGCNEDPKQKADEDYAARVKCDPAERAGGNEFCLRHAPELERARRSGAKKEKLLGEWKSVRAYDASDLEQWLEQSLQAQRWLSDQMGKPV